MATITHPGNRHTDYEYLKRLAALLSAYDNMKNMTGALLAASNEWKSTPIDSMRNANGALLSMKSEWESTPIDDSTPRFIRLEESFRSQFEHSGADFSDLTEYIALERMKISAELLLACGPDAISLELTHEGSVFYTLRKNDIFVYLDHYLVDEYDGNDQATVSVYKNNEKLLDFGGSLEETFGELNMALALEGIAFPAFA